MKPNNQSINSDISVSICDEKNELQILIVDRSKNRTAKNRPIKNLDIILDMNEVPNQKLANYFFPELTASTASTFNRILLVEDGDPIQRTKARIHRTHTVVSILCIFGVTKVLVPMAKKLLEEAVTYDMYHLATSLADLLSRYSGLKKDTDVAHDYHLASVKYCEIYNHELIFNWEYTKIRNNFGKPEFLSEATRYSSLAERIKAAGLDSIRLTFMYHELCFFHAFTLEDMDTAAETCRTAIDYFDKLPYDHQLAKNIFTFHLIDIYLLSNQKLAEAELLITNALQHYTHSKSQKLRFLELLKQVESRKKGVVVTKAV